MRWLLALLLFLVMASAVAGGMVFRGVDGSGFLLLEELCTSKKGVATLTRGAAGEAPPHAYEAVVTYAGGASVAACWSIIYAGGAPRVAIGAEDGRIFLTPIEIFKPLTGA